MNDLDFRRAVERFAARSSTSRRPRSDAGKSRLTPFVQRELERLLGGQERPNLVVVTRELRAACRDAGERPPSRATVYNRLARIRTAERTVGDLPLAVQRALYNLDAASRVPEAQIAFYCFNYGDSRAMSFAAALPWLALHQAAAMRGWRHKSRGVLEAVRYVRGI